MHKAQAQLTHESFDTTRIANSQKFRLFI